MAVTSGASTYAVGQIANTHFEQRGTFDSLDLDAAKEDFQAKYAEGRDIASSLGSQKNTQTDPIEALERLAALHKTGVLSDAEFADKKAELLARI